MYYLKLYDTKNQKEFTVYFDSYYNFRKRYYRVKYSKKLMILSMSNLVD